MKVERNKGKFVPITITIESEAEAESLWYSLGCPHGESLSSHLDEEISDEERRQKVKDMNYHIWNKFDDAYRPKGWKCG